MHTVVVEVNEVNFVLQPSRRGRRQTMQNNTQLDLFKVYNPTLEHVKDMFYTSKTGLNVLEELEDDYPSFDEERYFQTVIDRYRYDLLNPSDWNSLDTSSADFITWIEWMEYDVITW